eukprot:jgi/Mesvir1/13555/Mv12444-RA.1
MYELRLYKRNSSGELLWTAPLPPAVLSGGKDAAVEVASNAAASTGTSLPNPHAELGRCIVDKGKSPATYQPNHDPGAHANDEPTPSQAPPTVCPVPQNTRREGPPPGGQREKDTRDKGNREKGKPSSDGLAGPAGPGGHIPGGNCPPAAPDIPNVTLPFQTPQGQHDSRVQVARKAAWPRDLRGEAAYGASNVEPRALACGDCGKPCVASIKRLPGTARADDDSEDEEDADGLAGEEPLGRACGVCQRNYHAGCQGRQGSTSSVDGVWLCSAMCKELRGELGRVVALGPLPVRDWGRAVGGLGAGTLGSVSPGYTVKLLEGGLTKGRVIQATDDALNRGAKLLYAAFEANMKDKWYSVSRNLVPLLVENHDMKAKQKGVKVPGRFVFRNTHLLVLADQKGVVVAAAAFRTYGRELAEVPLFASRPVLQGHGRVLLHCLDTLLRARCVRTIYVPSIKEAKGFWEKGGFVEMAPGDRRAMLSKFRVFCFAGNDPPHVYSLMKDLHA